jgi:hypothetical protein
VCGKWPPENLKLKCKIYTDFQVIEGLALDKGQWLRSVNVGVKELLLIGMLRGMMRVRGIILNSY